MRALHDIPRLDQLDLNLLHVFDVVAREGSLSRAARSLAVTQSAVSHALARLRAQLGDALFVRHGRGVVATALAARLAPAIREAMIGLQRALARREFDPRRDLARLTLALPDELEPMVLPRLHARLTRKVPGLRIASVRLDRARLHTDLWSGRVDAALDVPWPVDVAVAHRALLRDRFCVAAARRRRRLDRSAYLLAAHVAVSSRRQGLPLEDFHLGARGIERQVAVRCRRYETALALVSRSDLLLTLPRHHAAHYRTVVNVRVFPAPVPLPPFEVHLYWHRASEEDPAHVWIRTQLERCLAGRA
jgi:DNA-binding transcriptional LysR family regulator